MKKKAVKGVAFTASAQLIRLLVQFGSIVILARLLTPKDFGIYAMVTPVTGFAALIQELGLVHAIVTAKTLTQAQAAALFRINLGISLVIAGVIAGIAPLVSQFYQEPLVVWITLAMACQIVIAGLTACHRALLTRGLRFKQLAGLEVVSLVAGFGVALVMAYINPSPWVLVAQTLTTATVTMVGMWINSRWLPVRSGPLRDTVAFLKFGMGMTGFNLSNFVSRNADNVLLGWRWGDNELGLYDRAYKLLLFPINQVNSPISGVLVPILSKMRDEPDRYRAAYLRTLKLMLLATVPLVPFMVLTAEVLIPLVLGPQWVEIVPIYLWLGLVAVHQTISNTFGWLFVSQQRTTEFAKYGIFAAVTCVAAFWLGLPYGAVGVAACYAISGCVLRLPAVVWLVGRRGPVSAKHIVTTFLPYLTGLCLSSLVWYGLDRVLKQFELLYLSAVFVASYVVVWATVWLWPGGKEVFGELRELLRKSPLKKFLKR